MRQRSLPQRIATWVLVALIAATLLRTWDRMRSAPAPVLREIVERPDLVKWDLPGCYVADASLFPTAVGVNPQVTIMALATRVAQRLQVPN